MFDLNIRSVIPGATLTIVIFRCGCQFRRWPFHDTLWLLPICGCGHDIAPELRAFGAREPMPHEIWLAERRQA